MKKKLLVAMMTAGLMAVSNAQDESEKAGEDTAAKAAEAMVKAKDLGAILKGQLVKIDGDEAKPVELEKGMEYYLVYHSASW